MHWPLHQSSSLGSASNPNRPLGRSGIPGIEFGLGSPTMGTAGETFPPLSSTSKATSWAADRSCDVASVSTRTFVAQFRRARVTTRVGRLERRIRPDQVSFYSDHPPFKLSFRIGSKPRMMQVHGHVAMPRFARVTLRSDATGAWRRRVAVGTDRRSAPLHRNFDVALASRAAPSRPSRHARCEEWTKSSLSLPNMRAKTRWRDRKRRGNFPSGTKLIRTKINECEQPAEIIAARCDGLQRLVVHMEHAEDAWIDRHSKCFALSNHLPCGPLDSVVELLLQGKEFEHTVERVVCFALERRFLRAWYSFRTP